jgi:anti-sigma factor RsiW
MKPRQRPHDELCRHVEGTLSEAADLAVEEHLRGCSRCATFVDGYASFLVAFDSAPDSPELSGSVERLDARMSTVLHPTDEPC